MIFTSRKARTTTFYLIVGTSIFGLLLITLNIYQLWHLPWMYGGIRSAPKAAYGANRRIVWINSKNIYHLNHVIDVFERVGYSVVHSLSPPTRWDVMWSFDYPFIETFLPLLKNLQPYQKVNHLPGTSFITLKVELATSKLKWIPQAFGLPNDKDILLKEVLDHPEKLWVQKSNNHRGIKIVNLSSLDLSAESTFVQLFVADPMLIDGKKFDIGLYVVVTSADPLRVYIYEDEILIRFCKTDYLPLDVNDVTKYVVGDSYYAPSELPSLQSYFNHGRHSRKLALFGYLETIGKNTKQLWNNIKQAVREVFIAKEKEVAGMFAGYSSTQNFFELVRFDFVIDTSLNIWLMEVNMSPNLSSLGHPENKLMYEQVIFHMLALVGIAQFVENSQRQDIKEMVVNDRNIMVNSAQCRGTKCINACVTECSLCSHCLSDQMKEHIKGAFLEHNYRGNYRRLLPIPQGDKKSLTKGGLLPSGQNNVVQALWFEEKCKQDSSWCQ